jgi:hypothetical protein
LCYFFNKELTFTGFYDRWVQCLWQTKIPLKIKIFLWQVINDNIQSAEQLKKRNWPGSIDCKMCGQAESTNHIFFHCALACFCWCVIRDVFGWATAPISPDDIYDFCRGGSDSFSRRVLLLFGVVAWSLWLIRNEFVFQDLVVSSPNVGIFRSISFLQKWKMLNKETEQQWIDSVTRRLNHRLSSLMPVA